MRASNTALHKTPLLHLHKRGSKQSEPGQHLKQTKAEQFLRVESTRYHWHQFDDTCGDACASKLPFAS